MRRRSVLLSYSNVDDKLEGYKIKSALLFKIFLIFSHFRARKVYEDANQRLREDAIKANDEAQGKEFRVMLLENWRDFELENQDEEAIKRV